MTQKAEPELVTSGPYRYVRHPIYSGLLLAVLGTALATNGYWLIVAGTMAAYFIYSATVEEQLMTRSFPTAYPAYRARTKMLILRNAPLRTPSTSWTRCHIMSMKLLRVAARWAGRPLTRARISLMSASSCAR